MKKFFASVGLAAIGASTLNAQFTPSLTPAELAKPWSVAASLRGFYNDNPLTEPNGPAKRSSYGVEVAPLLALNTTMNNTTVNLSYIYDLKWYEQINDETQSSHQFNANVTQLFSERFSMKVIESFVVAQEPSVIDPAISSSPLYTTGDNIHNNGLISATGTLSPDFDAVVSYNNNLYVYQQTFGDVYNLGYVNGAPTGDPIALGPSRSALLDRMEQLASASLRWKAQSDFTLAAGYQYGHIGYTSPEAIIFAGAPGAQTPGNPLNVYSKIRDNDSHYGFVEADKEFTATLSGTVRVGAQYLDYTKVHTSTTSPYVDANLTWTYMSGSYAQAGVRHQHSATDVVGSLPTAGGSPTLDAETTAAYLSINHQITGGFTGGLLGQYQHSAFNGGTVNGQSEDFFIVGLNFAYKFTEYLAGEAGYNWSKLVSDVSGRDYTENEVYIGVRASY
jgi:hypothetical protein